MDNRSKSQDRDRGNGWDGREAGSYQVNAEKVLTVTGYYPDCQAQENIGNYWSLSAYPKAKVENKVARLSWKTRVWQTKILRNRVLWNNAWRSWRKGKPSGISGKQQEKEGNQIFGKGGKPAVSGRSKTKIFGNSNYGTFLTDSPITVAWRRMTTTVIKKANGN